MAQQPQILKPQTLNLDAAKKYLKETESPYLLNYDIKNPSSQGKAVPFVGNIQMCEMEMPEGDTYKVGAYSCELTNSIYYWQFNSSGIHFIQRLNDKGICDIVYTNNDQNRCLQLSAAPENEITKFRAYVHIEKSDCANRHGVYLIWTNGKGDIGCIDIEASIATGSFSTSFFDNCSDYCDFIKLAVPQHCGCVGAEYLPLGEGDEFLTNSIADKAFQFSFHQIYYDRRASEWADPSTLIYQDLKGCFDSNRGFSRCIQLTIPLGNAMVEKVEIGFTTGDGVWRKYDTVDKFQKYNSSQQYWYERQLSEDLVLDGCNFLYNFCNNKQSPVIDPKEFSRVYNPIPQDAQSVLVINGGIGFVNYTQGTCPIDKSEINKFQIQPVYDDNKTCIAEMREITVRLIIWDQGIVYRLGGEFGDKDDLSDKSFYAGISNFLPFSFDQLPKDQYFGGRNFTVYVEGTKYFAEFEQYKTEVGFDNQVKVGVVSGGGKNTFYGKVSSDIGNNGYYYSEAKILIPSGMSGLLRISGHNLSGYNPDTSSKVLGTFTGIETYQNTEPASFKRYNFEIPFSCDDELIQDVFLMGNLVNVGSLDIIGNVVSSKVVESAGYIKDDIGNPLEGLEIWGATEREIINGHNGLPQHLTTTDHNGFYFWDYNNNPKIRSATGEIRGELDCGNFKKIQSQGLNRLNYGEQVLNNATISQREYIENHYAEIQVKVIDCEGNPIDGATISFSGSKAKKTNNGGIATVKVRNFASRNRKVTATVMSKFGCYIIDCDNNCNPCAPSYEFNTPSCYNRTKIPLRTFVISTKSAFKSSKGLKAGGNYPFGFFIKGGSKISPVYKSSIIDIMKTQEKGIVSFPSFKFDGTGMVFPDYAECLVIVRAENINTFELQWVIDRVEKTKDSKLKLTIQSLNDYNKRYFLKTNTNYQYIAGDRVEFIRNGDGKIFNSSLNGLLNYQILSPFLDQIATGETTSEANYFNQILIEDDGKLDNLKPGALIELQRASDTAKEPIFYSICKSIPIYRDTDGKKKLVAETGVFNTFDTYLVQRQIGNFSIQNFEHKTPSDFWGGQKLSDIGKGYLLNEFENQKRYGRYLSIGSPTQINYFGDLIKKFDAPEHGDITAINIVDGKIILAIGEFDTFMAQVANDLLRVGQDGLIRASSPDQVVSDAQPKLRGSYGCQYGDIGSILFGDGFASFIDTRKSAHVIHNYNEAKDISENKFQTWIRNRIQQKNNQPKDLGDIFKIRWYSGINSINDACYLTIKPLSGAEIGIDQTVSFTVNTNRGWRGRDESMAEYLTFHSFTPEGYANLLLKDDIGCAFITFFKGIPWLHPVKGAKQNNFYGIPCDMLAAACFNKYPEKIKSFISVEVQSDQMWYSKEVTTEKENFLSEIVPAKMKRLGDKWNSSLFGNKNTGELYSGKMPSGYYCLVLFIRDNTLNLAVNSENTDKMEQYSELDMISCKFSFIESSGNTENL